MGSPFFARIKGDVLAVMQAVPAGRLVTLKDLGAHLDVAPRHVAYTLAQLDPIEAAAVPWHRAVAEAGTVALRADGLGRLQRDLLEEEGHAVAPDGRILDLAARLVDPGALPHGVPRQSRPADAPPARIPAARRTRKQ
ncbi:MAG: MGMT family protein [Alsobacter sp.]